MDPALPAAVSGVVLIRSWKY